MATISRREWIAAGAAALPVFGLIAAASGQERHAPNAPVATPAHPLDPILAACILTAGQKQIGVCREALAKIENADVKAFAQAEIAEHETLAKKLARLGHALPETGSRNQPAPVQETGNRGRADADGGAAEPNVRELLDLAREVSEQCVATFKSEMAALPRGLPHDTRFVGSQLDAHYDLLNQVVVYRQRSSPELAGILDESVRVIKQHIETCKKLMAQLDAQK